MHTTKISPNYTKEKLANFNIDTLIDIFEDQVIGWVIRPAKTLSKHENGSFAVLHLISSYFESYAMFRRGEAIQDGSREYFREGLLSVFPEIQDHSIQSINEIVEILYQDLRCGLYYTKFPMTRVRIIEGFSPIEIYTDPDAPEKVLSIGIDPQNFLLRIEVHFSGYLHLLRDPAWDDLRARFIAASQYTRQGIRKIGVE
jgi:hypothetical protein